MSGGIVRGPRTSTHDQMPRAALRDERLSFRARGILARLLTNADGFTMTAADLARGGKEGREAILTALKELREAGYLRTERRQTPDGRWTTSTTVFETAEVGYPDFGFPNAGSPDRKSRKTPIEKKKQQEAEERAAAPSAEKKPGAPWRLVSGVRVYHGTDDADRLEALRATIGAEAFCSVVAALPSPRYVSHVENAAEACERERARERAEAERHRRACEPCETREEASRRAAEQMRAYAQGGAP